MSYTPVTTPPPWLQQSRRRFPSLKRNMEVDVVVVGAGITGVTTAYLLRKAGCRVALLERGRAGHADTGHTTAHLTFVTDARLHELVSHFGEEGARAVWEAGAAAIDQIDAIVRETGTSCGFRWVPGYLHAPVRSDADPLSGRDRDLLREDTELAVRFGFAARFIDRVPDHAVPGVRFEGQATFDPGRYLSGLLSHLANDGCHIFEDTAVAAVEDKPRRVTVAGGHEIRCSYVVLATHNPLMGSVGAFSSGLFQTKLSLYTSYVVGAGLPAGTVDDALFWDTGDPYEYLRIEPRGDQQLLIFGGGDRKTGQEDDAQAFRDLEQRLASRFPEALVTDRWLGQVIETDDGLPYIGEHAEREFIATGFSGNGMTFGTVAAIMARDAYSGLRNPWSDLFRVDRKPFHGGLWRYVTENLDYPWYLLRDRLGQAQTHRLDDVPAGEGRIVALEAGKCAVFRDDDGELTVCSAVCTHLKCLVRWNGADRTWDCPCHGSRFSPRGEVLSGPAEEPLQRVR